MVPFFVSRPLQHFADRLPDSSSSTCCSASPRFVFCLWGFVEMYCLKGSRKTNRFGADPLAPQSTRGRAGTSKARSKWCRTRLARRRFGVLSRGMNDAVSITRDLVRCPSVTPADAGALGVLEKPAERRRLRGASRHLRRARHRRYRQSLCPHRRQRAAHHLCRPYRRGAGRRRSRLDAMARSPARSRTASSMAAARST